MGIIDVKSLVAQRKEELKLRIEKLERKPKLVVIKVGNDPASESYVKSKRRQCDELGIECQVLAYPETTTTHELLTEINILNKYQSVTGILVQLPLPKHIDERAVIAEISYTKDVDGFCSVNQGKVLMGDKSAIVPCTPKGIMTILDSLNLDLKGKKAVIVGRSNIVGKPLVGLLLQRDLTVTICHSKTEDLKHECQQADVLIVAVGKARMINEDYIKHNAVVIDVGINRVEGKIVGDVCTERLGYKASVTPVPGGVGLTTVLSLLENLVQMAEARK